MGCDVAWERVGFALGDVIATIVSASVAFLARRKRIARADGAAAGPETMAAADEVAWSCLHSTMAFSTVAPVSNADVWGAFALRPKRADFEDGSSSPQPSDAARQPS